MEVWNPIISTVLYPYLHRFLLKSRGGSSAVSNSNDVFTEVFNLCRRAASDPTPGENLKTRYIDELKMRIPSSREAELIICLSWVVLSVQEQPSYAISIFTSRLQPLIRHYSLYNQARQLAITIRKNERHLKTDFFVTQTPHPNMKIEIEGNPGSGNTFIEHVENLNPAATTVITKHYHFGDGVSRSKLQESSDEELEALAEGTSTIEPESSTPKASQRRKKAKQLVDTEVVREEILTWVSKVRPLLDDAWKAKFPKIWEDILEMQEVKDKVYDWGHQKKTNFNQYLLGNILYFIFEDCGAWSEDKEYNASEVCRYLIGTTEHQLRKELGQYPPEDVKKRLHNYFTSECII